WAALMGWILGRIVHFEDSVIEAGVKGLLLGLLVSLAISTVDAVWNSPWGNIILTLMRVVVATLIGSLGGLFGGMVGQALFNWQPLPFFVMFGWTITGMLIGASIGFFDVLVRFYRHEDMFGAMRKGFHALLGGTAGGLLGSGLYLLLYTGFSSLFQGKLLENLWMPSGTGFIALGMCIGLLIGLTQVVLKEAWVRVEKGFRAGREMILSKPEITIGRAEGSDIALFGDSGVEKTHARIIRADNRYVVVDAQSPGGTLVNGQRIDQPTPLQSGDLIQVGNSLLCFGERVKRSA
ncbi:MAG: FHA domain-containing protein, partial [Mariprofundaceae bacterium]|nr:FHA domain-containing protein [Mariprofundaceae bacterium]